MAGLAMLAGGGQAVALAWPGAGAWAGQPLPGLQVLSLAVLVWVLRQAPSAMAALGRVWLFATAWLTGTFWWLFISMHTYGGLPAPLAVLAVLALAAFLGGYYALAGALCWRWRRAATWVLALVFAACWTLAELARGVLFTGFPWGAVGYAQVDALAWLAPLVGVYGMGAVAAWVSATLAGWLASGGRPRSLWLGGGLVLALALMGWPGAGLALLQVGPAYTQSTGRLPVTLLQGNVPQDQKFGAETGVPLALAWYAEQVNVAVQSPVPQLVVAPETAIPLLPQDMDPAYWKRLLHAVADSRSAVMLGLPLGNWSEGFTNSVAAWTPGLAMHRYDKHHLVPFGEFIPPMFRWFMALMNMPLGDFRRGPLGQAPLAWQGQRIAPNVCYEDLFGEELAVSFLDPHRAPTVLVNVSNIGWFGDSVAIDQHRHISRLRALELQRPMLRATNTGATAVIDHLGRVTQELPRLTRATLVGTVEGREGLTPYARWAGRWGLWPLAAVCWLVLLVLWPRRIGRLPS